MRLFTFAVALAVALSAQAIEVRLVLLPLRGLEGEADLQSRIVLVRAFRERGAVFTPVAEYRAAAEAAGVRPEDLATREGVQAVAPGLGVDAVLDVGVRPRARPPGREASLRVVHAGGDVVWEGSVPHEGPAITEAEAQALSGFAIGALGPGGRAQWERVVEPALNARREEVTPSPETLGFSRLAAAAHLTFRNAQTTPPAGTAAPVNFTTDFPYAGLTLDFEWFRFPLPDLLRERLGAGISYSYSPLRVSVDTAPGVPERVGAADHRFNVHLIGRPPTTPWGGQFRVDAGFAWQGFVHDEVGGLLPTSHAAPRFAAAYMHPLPWRELRLEAGGGVRPWASTGQGLPTFGDTVRSIGGEARVALSGSLESLAPHLRWMGGYDLLTFSDRLGASEAPTRHSETYHRIFVGVGYGLSP